MSSEEPRRFGLTHRQIAATVTYALAAPFLIGLTLLAGWAYSSSLGMIVFVIVAGGLIVWVLGYQLVTGRDIAHPPPPGRRPPPRL